MYIQHNIKIKILNPSVIPIYMYRIHTKSIFSIFSSTTHISLVGRGGPHAPQ